MIGWMVLLLMQSFMVSQSRRNSISLCGLRSELASFVLILSRFRLGRLHSDICLIAILGRLKVFGCNLSELCQDCLNPAIDPQFTGLHQDCKEPEKPVSGIARHLEDCVQGPGVRGPNLTNRITIQAQSAQIRFNRSAIRLNCIRIAQNPESCHNRPDCK